jgi:hypothetical protein
LRVVLAPRSSAISKLVHRPTMDLDRIYLDRILILQRRTGEGKNRKRENKEYRNIVE